MQARITAETRRRRGNTEGRPLVAHPRCQTVAAANAGARIVADFSARLRVSAVKIDCARWRTVRVLASPPADYPLHSSSQFRQTEQPVADRDRFEFGANWTRFLETVDESRIEAAVTSLRQMLGVESLE